MFIVRARPGVRGSEENAVSAAETSWDWDWESNRIDSSAPRAHVDPYGELRPVAVDESLTDLLFTGRPATAPVSAPAAESAPEDDSIRADAQRALFEVV